MFEKEAKEIAKRKISNFIPQQWGVSLIRTEPTWETVESAPHFYLNSLAKMWQDGAEFGYNKANEWHILAEEPDILPKEGQKVKVLTEDNIIQESTYFYDDYFEEMAFSNVGLLKVLAWKEIVLPELPKES